MKFHTYIHINLKFTSNTVNSIIEHKIISNNILVTLIYIINHIV